MGIDTPDVSICTVSLILIIGLLMLSGMTIPGAIPERFRVLMGSLMIFYSGYRFWTIWQKRLKAETDDDTDPT